MSLIPTAQRGAGANTFLHACLNLDQWPTVRGVTAYLGSFMWDLAAVPDGTLQTCFEQMRSAGLRLTIEVGAFKGALGCPTGQACFNELAPHLAHWIELGAPPIRLRMDEPFVAGKISNWNDNDTLNETVAYIRLMRSHFPSVAISEIEPFPRISAAELVWWIQGLDSACAAAGIAPPDSFEVDDDLNEGRAAYDPAASRARWQELIAIRDQAHARGWSFSYIFGSPVIPGSNWTRNALQQGTAVWYFDVAPDIYTFESWEFNGEPATTVPENSASPTFMSAVWLFRDLGLFPR